MKYLTSAIFLLLLMGCEQSSETTEVVADTESAGEQPAASSVEDKTTLEMAASQNSSVEFQTSQTLEQILAAQPEEVVARYPHRHPAETLAFFEVESGMTVVEALPGGGWYSKILMPLLGPKGQLIGVDYSLELWPNFQFMDEERLKAKETWAEDWVAGTAEWGVENGADVSAFVFGSLPESMQGTADRVLFIRAAHNLARFSAGETNFIGEAASDSFNVLKPGGIVGVVQHEARPETSDEWAGGQNGYLKKAYLVGIFEAAGFELVGESDINQNPKDQPGEEDFVWRLPPSLGTSGEDPELRAAMQAIGESNRMTLKFRKPQ